jgi:hypothetical protein
MFAQDTITNLAPCQYPNEQCFQGVGFIAVVTLLFSVRQIVLAGEFDPQTDVLSCPRHFFSPQTPVEHTLHLSLVHLRCDMMNLTHPRSPPYAWPQRMCGYQSLPGCIAPREGLNRHPPLSRRKARECSSEEASMRATWAVMALAVLILIACLAGGPDRRCYDCTAMTPFDPFRPVRAVILRPIHEAVVALEATADW